MNKNFFYIIVLSMSFVSCHEATSSPLAELKSNDTQEDICQSLSPGQIPFTYHKKGVEYASLGRFQEAEEQFSQALGIYKHDQIAIEHISMIEDLKGGIISKDCAIHFFKGGYHSLHNDFQQAITEFRKAIKIDPNQARLYSGLGTVYFSMGEKEKAITEFRKAIQIKPNNINLYIFLGMAYNLSGQFQQAITEFRKAIKIDPNQARLYSGLGTVYFSMGEKEKAIDYYQRAIQMSPYNSDAYSGLAAVYQFLGQYNKAIRYNKKAIQINPGDMSAYSGLGINYLYLDEPNKAIPCLKTSIEVNPYFINAYHGLGLAYFKLAQYENAKEAFEKAKELFSSIGDYTKAQQMQGWIDRIESLNN